MATLFDKAESGQLHIYITLNIISLLLTCTAGGNGIASALPVFEELSAAGAKTQGLPALLVWACRKGHEFEFMAAPVMAAAQALGLNLSVRLHVTGV